MQNAKCKMQNVKQLTLIVLSPLYVKSRGFYLSVVNLLPFCISYFAFFTLHFPRSPADSMNA